MSNLIISIIYLIFGLMISFIFSYFYLRHYPKPDVNFAFYFSVFSFGIVIFNIFLIPFDVASSVMAKEDNTSNVILDYLPIYYTIIGYFSQIVGDIISPIMILINTSGFYSYFDITKNVLYRFFTDYLSILKIIIVFAASFEAIHLYIKGYDIFEILRYVLLVLNIFPYLQILYYIGFVCQDFVYSNLKNAYRMKRDNYDLWKLGKIFKYYHRERVIVDKLYDNIQKEIKEAEKHNIYAPPEFNTHLQRFYERVKRTQTNILVIYSDREKLEMATQRYGEEIMKDENKNKIGEEKNLFKDMFKEVENEEDALKKELGSDYGYIKGKSSLNNNSGNLIPKGEKSFDEKEEDDKLFDEEDKNKVKEDLLIDTHKIMHKYKNWNNFKNYICNLMTVVNENSVSVERKSYLIDLKAKSLYGDFKPTNCGIYILIIIFYLVLLFFEIPLKIYYFLPIEIKRSFYGNLITSMIPAIFYFFIFNYAIIHHRYLSGDLIFGKHKSESINFYNFISFVLNYCDAMFFHSIWILGKNDISSGLEPKYFDVFYLPSVIIHIKNRFLGLDFFVNIIPYISMFIIIISIFNATKFSNIKIKKKEIILFNENADFFYNEKNLYSNFILGCGCFIYIDKNLRHLYRTISEIIAQ